MTVQFSGISIRLLTRLFFIGAILSPAVCTSRPNVVLVITDDQGWGDVHLHGNDLIDTPTMNRIAREGVRWEQFHVSPMCGPTRASLLTGRWNLRTGASWVSHGKEIVRRGEVTIADAFKAAGYATGAFGKWHNGEYGFYHPNDRGFDQFVGFCRGAFDLASGPAQLTIRLTDQNGQSFELKEARINPVAEY